jgi:predicted nucleic acid-binding protein
MMREVLVLDTCVLLSNVLRRMFFQLSARGAFELAWSPIIGQEWQRNAARLWNAAPEALRAQWQAFQLAFPQADLGDVSEGKLGLRHSDPKDWHVIGAARCAQLKWPDAQVAVVTRNVKDFKRSELRRLGLHVWEPDHCLWRCAQAGVALPEDALAHLALAAAREDQTLSVENMLKRERLFRYGGWRRARIAPFPQENR